jgi:protein-S-isoprenylcysteine O-methyltransferase Ste14
MTNPFLAARIDLVVAGLCLVALAFRTGYELLKKRGRVDTNNKAIFAAVFVAMCTMLGSWPGMTLVAAPEAGLPAWVHWLGLGLAAAGLFLAVGGLVTLRGLENIDHLVTTGLYARLRHPMYTGFVLWIVGWALAAGGVQSLVVGAVGIANVLFWRGLEENALRAQHGERYRAYCRQTWF